MNCSEVIEEENGAPSSREERNQYEQKTPKSYQRWFPKV